MKAGCSLFPSEIRSQEESPAKEMGTSSSKAGDTDSESQKTRVKKIYWDNDGNLRLGTTEHNREEEVINMLQKDSIDEEDKTKLWIIVPSRWLRLWLIFAHLKVPGAEAPGKVDMYSLLVKDANAPIGWRPKTKLKPPCGEFGNESPGHYRRVSLEVWIKMVELHGVSGYAIAVRGVPYDDKKRWGVFKDPRVIDINQLPEPVIEEKEAKDPNASEQLKGAATGTINAGLDFLGFGGAK